MARTRKIRATIRLGSKARPRPRSLRRILLTGVSAGAVAINHVGAVAQEAFRPYQPWLQLGATTDFDGAGPTGQAYFPMAQQPSNVLFGFVQGTGQVSSDSAWDVGVGFRNLHAGRNWGWGVNATLGQGFSAA